MNQNVKIGELKGNPVENWKLTIKYSISNGESSLNLVINKTSTVRELKEKVIFINLKEILKKLLKYGQK